MWVRGLKSQSHWQTQYLIFVALHVSAWIEISRRICTIQRYRSRTPCECVDWNANHIHTGRWLYMSHSMWVRGLKWDKILCDFWQSLSHSMWVRGLKSSLTGSLTTSLQSHSMWVRGLKYFNAPNSICYTCRTPCECVDWNDKKKCFLMMIFCRTPCECVDWNY